MKPVVCRKRIFAGSRYCYIIKDGKILLIRKKRGFGEGKLNAPGGKVEKDEELEDAVKRELQEEIGITPMKPRLLAEIEFFNDGKMEWHVYVFRSDSYTGELIETEEAMPHWFSVEKIPYDEMWADDRHWLPLFLQEKRIRAKFHFKNDWKEIEKYSIQELE